MLPVGWLIVAVLVAVVLSMWVTFTVTRLDRLHARVDAAQAALDAQLVRRAAALLTVAEAGHTGLTDETRVRYERVAQAALALDRDDSRELAENAVGRSLSELAAAAQPVSAAAAAELREAAARVQVARRFYNDAVRDTRKLRGRRMPRLLHLAGHAAMPQFFDIDDTLPAGDPSAIRPVADRPGPATVAESPGTRASGAVLEPSKDVS